MLTGTPGTEEVETEEASLKRQCGGYSC